MPLINVIDNKHARLLFSTEEKIVHHTFHKELDSETLRAVLNGGVELFRKYGATKWLSDNTAIDAHSAEDTRWINHEWLPRVIAAGWKYWALVIPNDVKARMNMVEFVNEFHEKGVRVMVFTDLNEAKGWLKNVDR